MLRLSLCVLLMVSASAAAPAGSTDKEYTIKAAFLYKLPPFVTWPKDTFKKKRLVIGVLGDDPFGKKIDALAGKKLRGCTVVVTRIKKDLRKCHACHVLFISSSEKARLAGIFKALSRGPIFTVGDVEHFAHRGGMMNMRIVRGKVRLEFNRTAAAKAGLKIHPKLLALGEVVK